jgi:hypothetical protein
MNSKLKFFITVFFFVLGIFQTNFAQTGKIKGRVIDANSGEGLIGANVMIVGTSIGTAADINGNFVLANLSPGNYTLKITYVGYKDKTEKVSVVKNRASMVTAKMDWIAVKGKEVVVTAQAKGQLSAINEQLSANEIKNVVSKDRIRELPDNNAAESVGRLPGVSLLRSGGEGNKVVIRGLQPKYSKVMVDGISLPATSSSDRSVSLKSVSSYSLEGIEVIKSPTADMDGDQVAGSVNFVMRTAPKGFHYDVIAQGGYNGLREDISDYMFVGSVSNRFFNNKLGVFAQVTTDRKNLGSNQMTAGYRMLSSDTEKLNPLGITSVNLRNIFSNRKRYGGTFTLDYLLPDGKIYLKNFLSSGETETQTYREGFGSSHSFSTSDALSNQLIYVNILNYEQYISIFKIKAKVSHSYSESETPGSIGLSFNGKDMNSIDFDSKPEDVPSFSKNEYDKAIWTGLSDNEYYTKGRQITASLDFETDFSLTKQVNGKVKFGGKFRYDERSYDRNGYTGNPSVASGADYKNALIEKIPRFNDLALGTSTFKYPLFFDHNFSHGNFLNGDYTLGPVVDIGLMHDILNVMRGVYNKKLEENPNYWGTDTYSYLQKSSVIYDYSGIERLGAGYVMAEINITKNIKFIPGIRYEAKNTTYSGVFGESGPFPELKYDPVDTTSVRNNDFWLPMIHLRIKPLDWLQIRLAYTQTIARPNFRYILPNMDINNGSSRLSMNNPNLRPEQAESFDAYFSFSENHLGLFTIGGFYKNIKDKIFSRGQRVLKNPEEYNLDSTYVGYYYSTQENNKDIAYVKGLELDWQTNFWYLPGILKGLVLNVNYTKIFSETVYPRDRIETIPNPDYKRGCGCPRRITVNIDESYKDRLQNQPSDIVNFAIGYDYKGFSSRLSMNYSTDIFISSNFWPELRRLTDDYLRWDLSVKQNLPWYGLQVYLNYNNITGTIEKGHFYGGKPTIASYYGSSINLGIRWQSN